MHLSTVHFRKFSAPDVQRLINAFNDLETHQEFKNGQFSWTPKRLSDAFIIDVLKCSHEDAKELRGELIAQGYFDADRLIPTIKGMALMNAHLGPRITRQEAEKIVDRLVEVAREQNERPGARVFIERLEIFGSYVSNRPDLGDVDVFVTMPLIEDLQPEDLDEMDRMSEELQAVSSYVSLHNELDGTAVAAQKITIYRRSP